MSGKSSGSLFSPPFICSRSVLEGEEVWGLVAKVENKSERPPERGAKCQSPPHMGFRDTLTYMYRTTQNSSGIKKIHRQRDERGETVKGGSGGWGGGANGTKGMCSEMGLDDAKVGKRIQRAQSRFAESHYLPQITWATSLNK